MSTDASRSIPHAFHATPRGTLPAVVLRRVLLVAFALTPVLISLRGGGDRVVYLDCAAACLAAGVACWLAAVRFPEQRVRWRIVSLIQVCNLLSYLLPSMRDYHLLSYVEAAWLSNVTTAASHTLFIPALMGMRSGRGTLVRTLDTVLMITGSALLVFAFSSGGLAAEGPARVWTGIATYGVLALLAMCARFVNSRSSLRHFSFVLSRYLGFSFIVVLLANVVLPDWTHHVPAVWIDVLIPLPELLLCDWALQAASPEPLRWLRLERAALDSMQPSVLLLGSVVLAMFAFRGHLLVSACVVVAVVLCYAVRTQAFYSRLVRERTRLRTEASQYQQLATRDPLTGIGNRRWFETNLQRWLGEGDSFPITLLLIDTDRFKEINDSRGHQAGDEVLCLIADVLQRTIDSRMQSCIARIGGDEFAVLLPGYTEANILRISERIRSTVQQLGSSRGFSVTVSIGVATLPAGATRAELLQSADRALYRAKATGRNGVQLQQSPASSH